MVIVGGGISGLATAWYLRKYPWVAVTLVEEKKRLGGKIVTERTDGFIIDGGPDSFLTQKPWAVNLCRELGLDDRLMGTNQAARKVYVLWRDRLHLLPDGLLLVVPTNFRSFLSSSLISPWGKIRMGLEIILPPRRDPTDESVAAFVRRRLGNEALDKIAEPLMGGIHVSDPEHQSLLASFPRLAEMERRYGSLLRGMWQERRRRAARGGTAPLPPFMTLRDGMGELVEALVQRLDGVRILAGQPAITIETDTANAYVVRLKDGTSLTADAVVLATPAHISARLLSCLAGHVADRLQSIRHFSTATVSLGFRATGLTHPLNGFGFVVPSKERHRIFGCTWSSVKFPGRAPDGHVLVRCFLGGPFGEEYALLNDELMLKVVREELRAILGLAAEPIIWRIFRWEQAHPQYEVGHGEKVKEIQACLMAQHPGLYLTGCAYYGVGIPDCIHQGEIIARQVAAFLSDERVTQGAK